MIRLNNKVKENRFNNSLRELYDNINPYDLRSHSTKRLTLNYIIYGYKFSNVNRYAINKRKSVNNKIK